MRVVKITKQMLKNPETLLRKSGATLGNQAYPGYVLMNSSDYNALKDNMKKQMRKNNPNMAALKVEYYVGLILLNLGPVHLKKGVEKGYLLVDDRAIESEKSK